MSSMKLNGIADQMRRGESVLLVVQGLFYLLTGLWPIIHLRSFEFVTGPKPEGWLVKTVGGLISVIGFVQLRAAFSRNKTTDVRLLSVGSALVLTAIDVIYVARRRISPIYLLDALAELALTVG